MLNVQKVSVEQNRERRVRGPTHQNRFSETEEVRSEESCHAAIAAANSSEGRKGHQRGEENLKAQACLRLLFRKEALSSGRRKCVTDESGTAAIQRHVAATRSERIQPGFAPSVLSRTISPA